MRCSSVTMTSLKSQDNPTVSLIESKNRALSLTRWHCNSQVKVVAFLNYYNFFKEKKALAFNLDRCCHLAFCLQLILFHLFNVLLKKIDWVNVEILCEVIHTTLKQHFPHFQVPFFKAVSNKGWTFHYFSIILQRIPTII